MTLKLAKEVKLCLVCEKDDYLWHVLWGWG